MSQTDPVQPGPPPPPASALTAVMIGVGIVLLLSGLCTLLFAGSMLLTDAGTAIRDVARGEPIMQMVLFVWVACLLVSGVGIWLLQSVRRAR